MSLSGNAATPTVTAEPESLPSELPRGVEIGRYVVLERIGSGGMGVVYAAFDPELDRKVALKLVRPRAGEAASSTGRTRLLREAQALAKLTHPNVVVVHDVGTHRDLVFVAMEFVAGGTLTQWLAEHPRTIADILHVMIEAGRGLAAAHDRGLVHRDFKPDNVMIDRAGDGIHGRVRVMDFGLARAHRTALDDPSEGLVPTSPGNESLALTRDVGLVGTPRYMSPEQLHRSELDERSDQFSFCVALYEALWREHPFGAESLGELAVAVLGGELRPEPKGVRVPSWIRRVVLRGLATDPAARWPSMHALLAALARDPTRRRRRVMLAIAPALVFAGVLGWRGLAERRREAACAIEGDAIAEVWRDDLAGGIESAFLGTRAPWAEDTWARVRPRLDDYAAAWTAERTAACRIAAAEEAATPDDVRACFDEQRAQLARLIERFAAADADLVRVAVISATQLGDPARCSAQSLAVRPAPPQDENTRAEVDALRLAMAGAYAQRAPSEHARAIADAEEIATRAEEIGYAPLISSARYGLGQLRMDTGDYAGAESAYTDAFHASVRAGDDLAAANAATRLVLAVGVYQARHGEGTGWARIAASLIARLHLEDKLVDGHRWDTHAALLDRMGKYDDAFAAGERASEIYTAELGPGAPETLRAIEAIAMVQVSRGQLDDALLRMTAALAGTEEVYGPGHPDLAAPLANLGTIHLVRNELDAAQSAFERALVLLRLRHSDEHQDVIGTELNLGNVLQKRGEYVKARAIFERALVARTRALGAEHPLVAETIFNIGATWFYEKDMTRAAEHFARALEIQRRVLGPDHPAIAVSVGALGDAYLNAGEFARAEPIMREALEIELRSLGKDHPTTLERRVYHANALRALGRHDEAVAEIEEVLALERASNRTPGPLHEFWLAEALLAADKAADALPKFEHAAAQLLAGEGSSLLYGHAVSGVGRAAFATGDLQRAITELARAETILVAAHETDADMAEPRFIRAKALVQSHRDEAEAVALARATERAVAGKGPAYAALHTEIVAWLREHDRG